MNVKIKNQALGRSMIIHCANVELSGLKLDNDVRDQNVELSTELLKRVKKALEKPGIYIPKKKNVPLYSVDENNPSIFIRQMNGVTTVGEIVNGKFEEVA